MTNQTQLLGSFFYLGAIGLAALGLYAVVAKRHVMRILLGLGLVDSGINLFLVAVGFRPEAAAPILTGAALSNPGPALAGMVDPIPQALVLTAIVIGVGVLALGMALAVRVQRAWGTLDTRELARRIEAQVDEVPAVPAQAIQSRELRP
jgi:multisubunit Na+/H+ antiporter MnhC subunit